MSDQEQKEFKMVEGVRNIHISKINTSNNTFGVPIRVRGLGEIKVTRTFKEGSAIGDMEVMLQKKKLKQLDVTITANELPPYIEAIIEGKTYENGELYSTENDNQNPVAILWEEVWSDGSSSYNAIYNIKLSRDGREGKGNSDNIDFQTIALSGIGLKSEIAKAFDLVLFDDDANVDQEKIDNFFRAVQLPKVAAIIPGIISVEYPGYTTGNVTDISLDGVTFDTASKKFLKIPEGTITFTFKVDGDVITSDLNDGTWSFVQTTMSVEYTGYTSGDITNISLSGVTFDTASKKFKNVSSSVSTFTFDKDGVQVTATLSGGVWSFA